VAVFATVQVGLNAALDRSWPEVRDARYGPQYSIKYQRLTERIARSPEQPVALMLGSSMTAMGFQPAALERALAADGRPAVAFNFGLFAGRTLTEVMCWRTVRAEGVRPDLLLVEVDPLALNEPGPNRWSDEGESLWLPGVRAADLPTLLRYHSHPRQAFEGWLASRGVPCFSARGGLMPKIARGWQHTPPTSQTMEEWMDAAGWVRNPVGPVSPDVRRGKIDALFEEVRQKWPDSLERFRVGAGPRRALAELVRDCRREGARVVLVAMPSAAEFLDRLPAAVDAGFRGLMAELRHGERVGLIDARRWLSDDVFVDHCHLTPAGAEAFSARFADEVTRLTGG
jgi:hypothetical protein